MQDRTLGLIVYGFWIEGISPTATPGCLARSNDAVNVLPRASWAYLNDGPALPALPFQDDARYPAAPRLRIWCIRIIAVPLGRSPLHRHYAAG